MNSTRELKNGTKAQKKTIKANKKQQLKQQQQQKQLQEGQKQTEVITTTTTITTAPPNVVTHDNTNRLGVKTTKMPVHNNINNNNNNHIVQNNNNINQKMFDSAGRALSATPSAISLPATSILPGYENAPKFERSNSFSLRGKLSKLLNSITGSKENLTRVDDENATPYKFTRSRSMILLRRTNRRSLIEPQLEQLCEETDPTSPSSPRKNSMEN
ncbi:PREDICTED: signal transducer and activator of transcription C-like [Rhagoletis zephyria]|uniref:signal transducer and activator of transcription C-like n=1 Tax=Rhagoletis zephyria TaxID=28612 RepID=UPI0008112B9D|nr:PREDICTED: signal transducer and activator of transcription C-like [Rhagoletis zephyria]